MRVIAVEPAKSPVLRGGRFGVHGIQGIGASFVPGVLNRDVYDEVMGVSDEGRLCDDGPARRGRRASWWASPPARTYTPPCAWPKAWTPQPRVVTILCDTGERYLSVDLESAARSHTARLR